MRGGEATSQHLMANKIISQLRIQEGISHKVRSYSLLDCLLTGTPYMAQTARHHCSNRERVGSKKMFGSREERRGL